MRYSWAVYRQAERCYLHPLENLINSRVHDFSIWVPVFLRERFELIELLSSTKPDMDLYEMHDFTFNNYPSVSLVYLLSSLRMSFISGIHSLTTFVSFSKMTLRAQYHLGHLFLPPLSLLQTHVCGSGKQDQALILQVPPLLVCKSIFKRLKNLFKNANTLLSSRLRLRIAVQRSSSSSYHRQSFLSTLLVSATWILFPHFDLS